MRCSLRLLSSALLTSAITFIFANGCLANFVGDCERNPNLVCYWTDRGYDLNAIYGGGGGGGTPTPVECIPSENGAPVGNGCGVFVAKSGDDASSGTKTAPVATLAKAVELAAKGSARVYACAETFEEALVLDDGVEIYGGLECTSAWAYVGATKKTTLTASADVIPLVMKSGASGAKISDVAITAKDAVLEGSSSIAVLAQQATAELVRCELRAGNGANGSAGMHGDPNGSAATSGAPGNSGKDACSDLDGTPGPDMTLLGGAQVTNDCGGDLSIGGRGGDGNEPNGGPGSPGQLGMKGEPGIGEPTMGAWDCSAGIGLGNAGSPGEVGAPGVGAVGPGTITVTGYTGASGSAGTSGKVGQGGGGGGGAKGGMICGGMSGSGASGGSGGAGGCGGLPGTGGGPGGASVALMSLNGTLTLTDSSLLTSRGGDGGPGGDAQGGGPGGDAGKGGQGVGLSNPACDGGKGGKGGSGGPGGGGLGGPSVGIAYIGAPITRAGKTVITPGEPGAGGPGGSSNVMKNVGEAGVVGEEQLFP